MVHTAKFPNTGIGFEPVKVFGNVFVQMFAGSFFLAFDNELDIAGQFTFFREDRVNGMQARGEMSLVITDAAPIKIAVADLGFEWRAFP